MVSQRSPHQLSAFLGINVKIIRLMIHQVQKPETKFSIPSLPFCFTRPKYKDYSTWLSKQDSALIKKLVIDKGMEHKSKTYEERILEINKGGLKITYPKLKYLYKKLNVAKSEYKEPEQLRDESMPRNQSSFFKQVEELIALELAFIKIDLHRHRQDQTH